MNKRTLLVAMISALFGGGIVSLWNTPAANTSETVASVANGTVKEGRTNAPEVNSNRTPHVSRAIDGDTLELASGERVRLIGIDTPESVDPRKPVQCFSKEASAHTGALVEGKDVVLVPDVENRDKYGRLLRYVYLSDGTFINLALVRDGYARVSTYPPNVAHAKEFVAAERDAREAKRGLWGDACTGSITPATEATAGPNGCAIKGNIGSANEKIYHLPSCPYYAKTRIDAAKGERIFCSEAEAQAAGWRKAMNCP